MTGRTTKREPGKDSARRLCLGRRPWPLLAARIRLLLLPAAACDLKEDSARSITHSTSVAHADSDIKICPIPRSVSHPPNNPSPPKPALHLPPPHRRRLKTSEEKQAQKGASLKHHILLTPPPLPSQTCIPKKKLRQSLPSPSRQNPNAQCSKPYPPIPVPDAFAKKQHSIRVLHSQIHPFRSKKKKHMC